MHNFLVALMECSVAMSVVILAFIAVTPFLERRYAAMFSKHSGFATLVGRKTGGDGIGTDPVYIILPNSEEAGTKPDIISPEGESPLDTCLEEIRKTNHKYN